MTKLKKNYCHQSDKKVKREALVNRDDEINIALLDINVHYFPTDADYKFIAKIKIVY